MTKTALILSALLLSGCAGEYTFNSNLDGKVINDYFKVGEVKLYQETLPKGSYELKGMVEGESCQVRTQDVPASISDARTQARRAAADKGANGLIIKGCTLVEQPGNTCVTQALCVGQAILLPTTEK
ncbi:Rcs stress response system protein RcsF [Shewanella marisflavi]|uniref:Rcs stress response system protein RcsF n=1 Tax=Shewanella marisflavi TaxID=260364 RepID=UPI0020108C9F|nr:Rcs stress response system protein RcsF [Shewanella marisflavi]MCL1042085.1 hypothetical protein [Shewanella marisflavi]